MGVFGGEDDILDMVCALVFGFIRVGLGMGFLIFAHFGVGLGPLRGLTGSSVDVICSVRRYE